MTSKAFSHNRFLYPEDSQEVQPSKLAREGGKYRKETVYDAVAGRISAAGFIPRHPVISSSRDTASSTTLAAAPDAVLFRKKRAPTRYAESDIYFAAERELMTELPESDLLKALHCYASDFYSRATVNAGEGDWRSMDETALIALGILMEEAARDSLGETGDLVFTEGEDLDRSGRKSSRRASSTSQTRRTPGADAVYAKSARERPSKRRRIFVEESG